MDTEAVRYQLALLRMVQGRPIAFYSAYAHALGSVTAALLLSQLCYWADKGHDPDGWLYKTQAELEAETGMGRREQETARRVLRAAGILAERKAGTPARLYFRVDFEALVDRLAKDGGIRHPRMAESATQAGRNPPAIRTETTPERLAARQQRAGRRPPTDPEDYFKGPYGPYIKR